MNRNDADRGGAWSTPTRRRALAGLAAAVTGATAGCAQFAHRLPGEAEATAEGPSFERLDRVAVYLADSVDLSVPDDVETVDSPEEADLVVLPDDTGVDAGRAVEWLTADRVLALLGDGAQSTWLEWARSDVYQDTFGGGLSEATPAPNLLVAGGVGTHVRTHRHTWGEPPDDPEVLESLDEDLVDLAGRTPR